MRKNQLPEDGGRADFRNVMYVTHCHDLSGLLVTYKTVLDWVIGFIDTSYTQLGTAVNYSAIADLHTLRLTVAHTLGFSAFTSRILATDS
jgi:hypothetical protein